MKLNIYLIFIISVLLLTGSPIYANIVINEIMSSNANTIQDEDGDTPDWIELYNRGDSTVKLQNWILTDNRNENKWLFPDIELAPDKYLIIFCSDKDNQGLIYLHTNFKLKSEGETIYLINNQGSVIDIMDAVELSTDVSYGRYPDGSKNLSKFMEPSPGESNNNNAILNTIEFSHKGGFYLNQFDLSINKVFPNEEIRYTTDGSEPIINSSLYREPIKIQNKNNTPNIFSMIRTNPENAPEGYIWKPPKNEVYKANVIRAATFKNGIKTSKIINATYFVDGNIFDCYSFPIISIITDSINLFGFDEGIYVPGKVHAENPNPTSYWGTGNYHERGDDWERPVHIEFFETDGRMALSQNIGIRIHGSGGRALPEKALRLYARSEYGQNIFNYQIFPEREKNDYKRLLLRNSGQDFLWTLFADALIQDLSKNTGIEYMAWRPSVVFINGEYWGIHNIRERYDEYYLADYCDVEPENIQIYDIDLMNNPYKNSHYNEMYEFISCHDLSDNDNFDVVTEYLDIDNLINYTIQKVYFGVYDWPGNNLLLWRADAPGSKWRWLSFDNDDGLMYVDFNSIEHITADSSEYWRNPPYTTYLFRKLMENENFRKKFFSTLELRMNTVFREDRILQRIDEFETLYEREIDEHIDRWGYPESKEYWLECIDRLKSFVIERRDYLNKYIDEYLENTNIDDNYDENALLLYPNPNRGIFDLVFDSRIHGKCIIKIFNVLGEEVYSEETNTYEGKRFITIKLPNISDGLYILKLINEDLVLTSKIVVNK
jgi:hypothetical protein